MNKALLIGRLTADPIVRQIGKDPKEIVRFSIATNVVWNDKSGQRQEKTEFHNILVTNGLVEKAKSFKKADTVVIEGRMHTDVRKDQDGKVEKKSFEVIAQSVELVK